jgi:hypothetical protein
MPGIGRNVQPPPPESLPSTRRLLVLSVLAAIAVSIVWVGIVLPAERGVDPTGLGRLTGLEMMGRIKLELAMDAADHEDADRLGREADSLTLVTTPDTAGAPRTDETRIGIAPRDSSDVFLIMRRGAAVTFEWSSSGSGVDVVTLGDSLNTPRRAHHIYRRDAGRTTGSGELGAAFDGFHGWRWHNKTDSVVTIRLKTSGRYLGGRESSSAQ